MTLLSEEDFSVDVMDKIRDCISSDLVKKMISEPNLKPGRFVFICQIFNDIPLINGDIKALYIESHGTYRKDRTIKCDISKAVAFDKGNIPDELLDRFNDIKRRYP